MDIDHENGASKSSEIDVEGSVGSGINEDSLRQPELIAGNRNRRDSSESTGISDQLNEQLELDVETGSKPLEAYPGGRKCDPFYVNPDVSDANESNKSISSERLRLSSSSSSPGSSIDDQVEANTNLSETRSGTATTSYAEHDDEHHVSGGSTPESKVPSHMDESTLTQSPPIQVMDRVLKGFDPYRIPSSVFDKSESTNPADWSTASNDSLFSIQVGNTSFSRDHFLSLKYGEFFKDELFTLITSPVAYAVEPDKTSFEFDKISDYTAEDKTYPSAEEQNGETTFWNSPSTSRRSNETGTSEYSFAFPVLEGDKYVVSNKEKGDQHQQKQPQDEQQQQQEEVEQEQEPRESAVPSKPSSWLDNCSCFPCCRQQWQCCNWHWCRTGTDKALSS